MDVDLMPLVRWSVALSAVGYMLNLMMIVWIRNGRTWRTYKFVIGVHLASTIGGWMLAVKLAPILLSSMPRSDALWIGAGVLLISVGRVAGALGNGLLAWDMHREMRGKPLTTETPPG